MKKMNIKKISIGLLFLILALVVVQGASAYGSYVPSVAPNCGVCHISADGGGPRTVAGDYFKANGQLPPTATPAPTAVPTAVPTATPVPTPVPTATPTPAPEVTPTPTTTVTATPTSTFTATPTATPAPPLPPPPVPESSTIVLVSAGILGVFLIVGIYNRRR
jgi:hypothetical protein